MFSGMDSMMVCCAIVCCFFCCKVGSDWVSMLCMRAVMFVDMCSVSFD
jgi:hypothetical protein